jgi:ribosomal protein S12
LQFGQKSLCKVEAKKGMVSEEIGVVEKKPSIYLRKIGKMP